MSTFHKIKKSWWLTLTSFATITSSSLVSCSQTSQTYTITWLNEDGTILETDSNVEAGSTPVYNGDMPKKADELPDKYYIFNGWSPSIEPVKGDQTYQAQYLLLEATTLTITIPSSGTQFNFSYTGSLGRVDWGDSAINSDNNHIYTAAGDYTIKIYGRITSFSAKQNSYIKTIYLGNLINNIDSTAFKKCESLTEITIPKTVTKIDTYAFSECKNLKTINIPDSVTAIGNYAFNGCSSLTKLFIPKSVTTIGNRVFIGCIGLTEVKVDKDNPTFTSCDGSNECNAIINIKEKKLLFGIKNTTIPSNVNIIGREAFASSLITSITIPTNVTSIESNAFEKCELLKSITLHNNLTSLGGGVFKGCKSLTTITIPSQISSIQKETFESCESLTTVMFTSSISEINDKAFQNCQSLKNFYMPNGLVTIGNSAFRNCSSLTIENNFPQTLTTIGDYAFEKCSSLTSVVINKEVTYIGEKAFSGTTSLTSIIIDEDNLVYTSANGANAIIELETGVLIQGCKTTIIPSGVTYIGVGAFQGCNIETISIPSTVIGIGDYAFDSCSYLTTLNMQGATNVASIGQFSFNACYSIDEIYIPKSLVTIGLHAFNNCACVSKITVENGNAVYTSGPNNTNAIIEKNNKRLIRGCASTIIPADANIVTSIGEQAFEGVLVNGNTYFTSINIPTNIDLIANHAFAFCYFLEDVHVLKEGNQLIAGGYRMFYNCMSLVNIYVPSSNVANYKIARNWSDYASYIKA